jgi:hypothetical protein
MIRTGVRPAFGGSPARTSSPRTSSTRPPTPQWLPGQSKAAGKLANEKFSYQVRDNGAMAISSSSLSKDGGRVLWYGNWGESCGSADR